MKLYYYVHTGHRVGLERLRRSAPVINALLGMDVEVTLLTSDFRAGEFAKEQFGIRRYVSVDVPRNIANIATPADALIYDSAEESRAMWEEMAGYFHRFFRFSDEVEDFVTREDGLISSVREGERTLCREVVDPRYFVSGASKEGVAYFWGDDDYAMELQARAEALEGLGVTLLEGYYFFMQYGDELARSFARLEASEAYDEVIASVRRFLTSSPQSALEALAAGAAPLYLPKPEAPASAALRMARCNIPVVPFEKAAVARTLSETPVYETKVLRKEAAAEVATYIKDNLR